MAGRQLSQHLLKAGHSVVLPSQVGFVGAADPRHLLYALSNGLALVTANYEDFKDLHDLVVGSTGCHAGILLVFFDNDPSRDMKPADIVRALGKLEKAQAPVADQLIVLNQWR